MTPDTGIEGINFTELLEKKRDHLPKIIIDYQDKKLTIDDKRSRLKLALEEATHKLLITENQVDEAVQTIRAIYILEKMRLIDEIGRKAALTTIYSSIPDSVAEKIEDKWSKMQEEIQLLFRTA